MALKQRISSPLEAGTSILDAHNLPPHLLPALDHVSTRLARKSIHLTLVVVRRDYQLPLIHPPLGSPGLSTPVTPGSASRFGFAASSPVAAFKQLVRAGSSRSLASARSVDFQKNLSLESMFTPQAIEEPSSRMRWPLTPATPVTPLSPPPMTPCTTASSTTTDTTGMGPSGTFGMRLVHLGGLRPNVERTLTSALTKASQKFGIGSDWLSPAAGPSAYGLTKHVVHSSIVQNEVLYSSEGLTLVSLDGLYSLKSALSSYSKTRSPMRLEDAVDELRRLVLSNNGCKVSRSDLLRSYDWLSLSSSAITDLDRMYRRAYGGLSQVGAISGMSTFAERAIHEPIIRSDEDLSGDDGFEEADEQDSHVVLPISMAIKHIGKTPSPKAPALKLQTTFAPLVRPIPRKVADDYDDENDGDRTARPTDHQLPIMFQPWNSGTIDQVLSAVDVLSPAESVLRLGPMTPNGHDDISPTTRGEWGFLMVDDAFQGGRTVRVETF